MRLLEDKGSMIACLDVHFNYADIITNLQKKHKQVQTSQQSGRLKKAVV